MLPAFRLDAFELKKFEKKKQKAKFTLKNRWSNLEQIKLKFIEKQQCGGELKVESSQATGFRNERRNSRKGTQPASLKRAQ